MLLIRLEGVSYKYEERCVLDRIDLDIKKGEKVTLLGCNGSGKSTLLRIIAGLYFASEGSYLFEDMPVSKKNVGREFRQKVGIVFQNPESMIFNPTVKDEIAFSLKEFGFDEVEARVVQVAETFGIAHLLGKNPLHLSGGEKQKVMLAAIVAYEPEILLLDEPTAAMDPKTSGWFIDLMIDLDKTVLLATHDLALAYEVSDRAVVLGQTHQKFYDGVIEALYGDLELLQKANLIHKHKHKHKHFVHSHYHGHF